jgi:FkbM family methyltransferase
MGKTLRVMVKEKFDLVAYRYAGLNKILRNLNKAISPITAFRLRPFGVMNLTLKSGLQFKLATNETSAVAKKIFWHTPDQYEYTLIFEKLAKKCTAFADIGANIGYYSLLAARANPSMKVYAFEPAAGPFHFLKKNVAINRLENQIEIFAIALSNTAGSIEFQEIQSTGKTRSRYNLGGAGKILKDSDSRSNIIPILVPAETMDVFFEKRSPLPDLIKMDTEGTENMILDGAQKIIHARKPIIICETLFHVIERELEEVMRKHGYRFYNHVNGKLVRTDTLTRTTDNGVSDCFFVHPEKEHLILEFV